MKLRILQIRPDLLWIRKSSDDVPFSVSLIGAKFDSLSYRRKVDLLVGIAPFPEVDGASLGVERVECDVNIAVGLEIDRHIPLHCTRVFKSDNIFASTVANWFDITGAGNDRREEK